MKLESERELANTREKLRMLKEAYEESRTDSFVDAAIRDRSLRSLKRLINQLKEEIARYNAHLPTLRPTNR